MIDLHTKFHVPRSGSCSLVTAVNPKTKENFLMAAVMFLISTKKVTLTNVTYFSKTLTSFQASKLSVALLIGES